MIAQAVARVGSGNGAIDPAVTSRVVGVDINPAYLDATRQRFDSLRGLELHCCDLANEAIAVEPVDLVHAALIFEHAGTTRCLENAISMIAPGGRLSVVLQTPSEIQANVGSSGVASIQRLGRDFSLVDPPAFVGVLASRRFELRHESIRAVAAGKAFWSGTFGHAT
jgi:SAM-dependent methyltransferase